jgi:hypothetical protein
MQVCHGVSAVSAVFDDPNLVSCAGLVPVMRLAADAGLQELVAAHVRVPGEQGANQHLKVPGLVAGMVAGADSIDDMDLLRHGGMDRLFEGVRAPSTLGLFLRAFTFGHVRQLDAVASRLLVNLTGLAPIIADADQIVFVDIDDTIKPTYGYAKQGAGYGYTKVKGLNAILATISTPLSAPLIAAARLRRGASNSARGAPRLVSDALATTARCPVTGMVILRADSAYYNHGVVTAAHRGGAYVSITTGMDAAVRRAIAGIDEDAWTGIRYPQAIFDDAEQRWISDAEVAEVPYTAFKSKGSNAVSGRLIVRRVKRLNPATCHGQDTLFDAWRHHAVFTTSPLDMLQAEAFHRGHAIVEQVIADLKSGPLAHLPSGKFNANAAWLACAVIAFNLTRAAGALASTFHAKATTATIRDQLIKVPARIASSARKVIMHLPRDWPWETAWQALHHAAGRPPPALAAT